MPFEIYRSDKFVLYYEEKHTKPDGKVYPKGCNHLLTVKKLATGEKTGMWIDPTDSSSERLNHVLKLQQLKASATEAEYNHEAACFIEGLIANRGFSSLQIAAMMKEALRHHKEPKKLLQTIVNTSKEVNHSCDDRQGMSESSHNIVELKNSISNFLDSLMTFVCNILGIAKQVMPPEKDAKTSPARAIGRLGTLPDKKLISAKKPTLDQPKAWQPSLCELSTTR